MKSIFQKLIGMALISILLASTNVALAATQSEINDKKKEQQESQEKIKENEEKKEKVTEEKNSIQQEVDKLNDKISDYEGQITSLDTKISDANTKIKEEEKKLAQAEQDYKDQEELIKKRMVAVYTSGDTSYLDVLLSSKNLTDFISSYYLVSEVTKMDAELLDKIQKQKEEIETAKKEIENNKTALTASKEEKENVNSQLKVAKTEKTNKVAQLSNEEQKIQQEIDDIKDYEKRVSYKLAELEKEFNNQKNTSNSSSSKSPNSASNNKGNNTQNSTGNYSGGTSTYGFGYPVANHATSNEFGLKKSYYHSSIGHTGLDFTVKEGTPVYAIGDGAITLNYDNPKGWGTNLMIMHKVNGQVIYSFYAHLSSAVVTSGFVTKGTLIGYSGNTGTFSQGAHLHFEIRAPGASWDKNCKNPRNYLP